MISHMMFQSVIFVVRSNTQQVSLPSLLHILKPYTFQCKFYTIVL